MKTSIEMTLSNKILEDLNSDRVKILAMSEKECESSHNVSDCMLNYCDYLISLVGVNSINSIEVLKKDTLVVNKTITCKLENCSVNLMSFIDSMKCNGLPLFTMVIFPDDTLLNRWFGDKFNLDSTDYINLGLLLDKIFKGVNIFEQDLCSESLSIGDMRNGVINTLGENVNVYTVKGFMFYIVFHCRTIKHYCSKFGFYNELALLKYFEEKSSELDFYTVLKFVFDNSDDDTKKEIYNVYPKDLLGKFENIGKSNSFGFIRE